MLLTFSETSVFTRQITGLLSDDDLTPCNGRCWRDLIEAT